MTSDFCRNSVNAFVLFYFWMDRVYSYLIVNRAGCVILVSGKNPSGKKPPWGVSGRIRVRLGIGLGLESGDLFFSGRFFFPEPLY